MRAVAIFIAAAAVAACGAGEGDEGRQAVQTPSAQTSSAQTSSAPAPSAYGPITGKVWVLTENDGRPGVMRVFLDNGVLIQDSCWETYRLSRWRFDGDARLVWNEDGRDITASVEEASGETLTLRVQLTDEEKVEAYRALDAPYVCPDLPR